MSRVIPELELVGLVKSFLSKPRGTATGEEVQAWDELYRDFARNVRARLGRKHRGWTDDLFQLVWIIFEHKLKTSPFDPARDTLDGWIARIVRDVVGRHNHRFSKHREEELAPDLAGDLPDPEDGPDVQLSAAQLGKDLRDLIESLRASLSERDHRILTRRWIEDRSVTEIMGELMLTRDCVTSVIYRVSLKLRELLAQRGLESS